MNEQFLQYIWKNKLLQTQNIITRQGNKLRIVDFGLENMDAGPDFLNCKIEADGILWAGNVEIHVNASDWYKHNHQNDNKYKNIILHVVYNDDINEENTLLANIPTIEIRNLFDKRLLEKYISFISSKTWIPCFNNIENAGDILVMNWLSRLLVERMERKTDEILHYYNYFNNDWLETFYYFLCRNFGFKKNSVGFEMLAKSLPYKILSKHRDQIMQLEALLFGQAGLLNESLSDSYAKQLFAEYIFLSKKYNIKPINNSLWNFSKLRPPNFPTIRLAQFAKVVKASENVWKTMIEENEPSNIKKSLSITASDYWNNHYVFGKESPAKPKNLGETCIENILINTIGPVMFLYGKQTMKTHLCEKALNLFADLKPEKNSITDNWVKAGIKPVNAADSQALIELKKNYCTTGKCLRCAIGTSLLKQNYY